MKIAIADAQTLARETLARVMIDDDPSVEVLETDSLDGALAILAQHPELDLLILDLDLPDARGLTALEACLWAHREVPVIVLSGREEPTVARASIEAGARGFVSKRSSLQVLAAAVRLVLAGGSIVPPEALRAPPGGNGGNALEPGVPRAAVSASIVQRAPRLTHRQQEVLSLIAEGLPNKVISRRLNLAENTVKAHAAALYRALGVANRTQALFHLTRQRGGQGGTRAGSGAKDVVEVAGLAA
jgi:DNA-binding NarL/FixJ family response regulator